MTPDHSAAPAPGGEFAHPSQMRDSHRRVDTTEAVPGTPSGARKLAFATFVRRALETARTTRAWNGSEVARRTGVSRQTINRWVRGDWASDPEPDRVVAFCAGLGVDTEAAFALLEWHGTVSRQPPSAAPMDPDVAALLRRLADPAVSRAEKFHIRETVRYLAYRPALPKDLPTRRQRIS